jgi:hypothetical protein
LRSGEKWAVRGKPAGRQTRSGNHESHSVSKAQWTGAADLSDKRADTVADPAKQSRGRAIAASVEWGGECGAIGGGWTVTNLTTLAPDIVAAILDESLADRVTLFDLA